MSDQPISVFDLANIPLEGLDNRISTSWKMIEIRKAARAFSLGFGSISYRDDDGNFQEFELPENRKIQIINLLNKLSDTCTRAEGALETLKKCNEPTRHFDAAHMTLAEVLNYLKDKPNFSAMFSDIMRKMPTARTVAAAAREGARLALDEDPGTHRKKGGGRKPKYQNGKNQVLEVLKEVCTAKTKASALAYSETVFNRWARSKKPHGYTSAKSLDSRVRDYLKANELPDLLDDTAKEKIKAHLDRLQKPHAVTK